MAFDAKAFAASTTKSPLSTQILPCPEGAFTAFVDDSVSDISEWFREVTWKDKQTGQDRSAQSVRIPFSIKDDGVRAKLGREKIIVPYDVFLDLDRDGNLDESEGKNVKIGQLYEALGMNGAGASLEKIRGRGPVMVKVSQRSDPKDPQTKYAQVDRVAKVT